MGASNEGNVHFFVDCDFYKDECNKAGVEAYPTWVINDKLYRGEQPLNRLAQLTNCTLPK